MARTFIGELVLRLKDEISGKAKEAATNVDTSMERIQKAADRMNKTTWGGSFEEKLRKLGASSGEIDKLRTSWENLNKSFADKDISKAMQAMEKGNFKAASLSVFAELATNADKAENSITRMHNSFKDAMKDMAVWSTTGALMYGGVEALRGGFEANAKFQKELFAQQNARISTSDQARILAESDRLTTQYPSAGLVNAMMMARSARAMMGDTERGLSILPDMVKGLVALQSAKNPDVAVKQLQDLLRGIDNAGKNQNGELGIENSREIIAGMIRAAQIEGGDIDPGKFFDFARAGKIAVPGLSTEFLATIQPALSQDMKPESFGKALSSAYQAFVIGSTAVTNKDNIANQRAIGIREGDENGGLGHLVNDHLFGTNPYQWVKQVLIPALAKSGTDMNDPVAIGKDIAKLSRNQNVSGLLTRMVTQQQQVDRLIEQYRDAVGPDAADAAAAKDPFVAWKGFVESWRELATAIKGMPEAVSVLNSLTAGLQKFSTALRNDSGLAQLGLATGGALGAFGAFKMMKGIWDLSTAGTSLQAAAASLEAAALSLKGAGAADILDDVGGKSGKKGWLSKLGGLMPWIASTAKGASIPTMASIITYNALEDTPHAGLQSALKDNPDLMVELENDRRRWQGVAFESGMHRAGRGAGPRPGSWENPTPLIVDAIRNAVGSPDDRDRSSTGPGDLRSNRLAGLIYELMKPTADRLFEQVPVRHPVANATGSPDDRGERSASLVNPYTAALDYMERRQQMEHATTPYNPNTPGLSEYFKQDAKPTVDMSDANAAASEAQTIGDQIMQALSVQANPSVNNAALRETLALVNAIKAGLAGIGGAIQSARASVGSEMRRNFADTGVKP